MSKQVLVKFLTHTCSYKKDQFKRVCLQVAKAWEKKKIAKIVRNR